MATLPTHVEQCLTNAAFRRENPEEMFSALARLGVQPSDVFLEFYKNYAGPFGSKRSSFELLDLVLQDENIERNTELCRKQFAFPKQYLVISGLLAGSVLVYDTRTDRVFNVDFEGGEKDLVSGVAKPQWETFYDFIGSFFG
jgi:hypothetical protein